MWITNICTERNTNSKQKPCSYSGTNCVVGSFYAFINPYMRVLYMEIKHISSLENEYIKKVEKLKTKKFRDRFGLFVAEGERSVRDALASDFAVESVIVTEEFLERRGVPEGAEQVLAVSDKIFARLCDTETPQGILAVVALPEKTETLTGKRYLYCDCLQDPGNAGTVIRSADAFGFDGVIVSKGSVDVFSPKVIRSSMGSVFHVAMITDTDTAFLQAAKDKGYFLSVTALHKDSVPLGNATISEKQIFVIGNEGNGVSDAVLSMADETVHIPMQGLAESLNAGVAASILMYEVSCHA